MKAIDVATDTTGHAHALVDAGIEAVGLYLRRDRCSKPMVDGLALAGIKRFSVYEKGFPTTPGYFTVAQGRVDALNALEVAEQIGQPAGSQIFMAVDFDASLNQIGGPIEDYFAVAQKEIKAAGYLCSVYGSGMVCARLVKEGLAHSGWLAQSKGWAGYSGFLAKAAIVQGPETTLLGMDVDTDQVMDASVTW